jgi:hypothetical protein
MTKESEMLYQSHRLVLEIEVPGFYVADIEASLRALGDPNPSDDAMAEEAEQAMCLASETVGLTFVTHEGDSPGVFVKAMEGEIVGIRVKRP